MPGSRSLKGLASGLAETFISRNNDVSGYWGIGMLRRELENLQRTSVELDLLLGEATRGGPVANSLIAHYSQWLAKSRARAGFLPSQVAGAKVIIDFRALGKTLNPALVNTYRQAFSCEVSLVSLSGRIFSAVREGLCWRHDPKREQRRRQPDNC
jgi:hypothetical protein